MKKQFIENLHPGDDVDDVFYVLEKEIRQTKEGKDFIIFQLRDRTGILKALLFEPGPRTNIPKGSFARVQGRLTEYNGRINLKINDIWQEKEANVDYRDFLPTTKRDVEACYRKLKQTAHSVREPLAALVTAFFDNSAFERQFKLAPAGVRAHHAYLGGLCIHTYDMLTAAEALCELNSDLDKDLLLAGVLLHDIGKIREYEYTRTIDNTDEGKLLGHIVIGTRMIEREIERIPRFPEKLACKLLHMVISHHGFMEYGSPRRPLFLEAEILHQLDNLNAKRAMYEEVAARSNAGERWSEYHPYLEHDTYLERDV
jgi:3'-5' exoribonuclease